MTLTFVFLLAALAGAACTWAARGLALRWGIVNHPNPIVPQHRRPVAYLGGVGLAGGIAVAAAAAIALRPGLAMVPGGAPAGAIVAGALLFLAVGLADDLRAFAVAPKLVLQFGAALVAAAAGLVGPDTGHAAADVAITAFWMVLVVNAVNLTDVCDGLVSSITVAVFLVLAPAEPALGAGPAVVAGAALGVLAFNRPPASIFLGDAGSHLIGFLLAAATLVGVAGRPAWPALPWALLAAGVFLFETAFIVVQRLRRGLPWWRGSPDHFSLRLQAAGVGRGRVDAGAALVGTVLAGCGAALWWMGPAAGAAVLAALVPALVMAWRALARLDVPVRPSPPAAAPALPVAEAAPPAGG